MSGSYCSLSITTLTYTYSHANKCTYLDAHTDSCLFMHISILSYKQKNKLNNTHRETSASEHFSH